jgi:deoxyadenosine/deoxycytidine kinase
MRLEHCRLVAVEGPIGVGKTTLTNRLAAHLAWQTLLERPEENPFLARFYEDPERHALATQLFFLFQRINELRGLTQMDLFSGSTVADYLFDKDALFARLTLSDDEFALYQNLYRTLALQAPTPDLVIYLQASPATLAERVKQRARAYEQPLAEEYLVRLSGAYSDFFYNYTAAPVLVVDSENLNFVDNAQDFSLLLARIEAMRGQREFLSKGA